jgi:hypothetical protein
MARTDSLKGIAQGRIRAAVENQILRQYSGDHGQIVIHPANGAIVRFNLEARPQPI